MTDQLVLGARTETLIGAMAAIVQEMVGGGLARLPGADWLGGRMDAAPLDPCARAGLEALHAQVLVHGGSMLDAFGIGLGLW